MNREQIREVIEGLDQQARGVTSGNSSLAANTLTLLRVMTEVIYGEVVDALDDLDNAAKGNAVMTDQPKLCPGCGGEMRGDETAYPCGRKPVAGSLETTQCVRHQLFDARAKVADIREAANRLAALLIRYRDETPMGHQPHMIKVEVTYALANYRRAVSS